MQVAPAGSRALSSRSTGLPRAREAHPVELEGGLVAATLRLSGDMAASERMPRNLEPMLATPGRRPAGRRRLGVTRSSGTGSGRSPTSTTRGLRIAARRGDRPHAPLPGVRGDRRGARRPRGDPRRRDRRLRRRRPAELSAPAAADGPARPRRRSASARPRRRPPTSPSTCSGSTAARCSPSRTSARRELLAELGFDGPNWQAPAPPRRRRRPALGRDPAAGPRGRRREAARQPVPARPAQRRVAQGPLPARAGARDRRLDAGRGHARRPGRLAAGRPLGRDPRGGGAARAPAAARLRRRRRHRLHAGDARAAHRALAPLRRDGLAVRARRGPGGQVRASGPATAAPARSGSSRSSSARSSSPSGRARARCASRRSRACATTRTRARSSARPERIAEVDRAQDPRSSPPARAARRGRDHREPERSRGRGAFVFSRPTD